MENETDVARLARVEQQLSDHLISCTGHYDRNDMAHEKIFQAVQSMSARLWALILSLFTLGVGAVLKAFFL